MNFDLRLIVGLIFDIHNRMAIKKTKESSKPETSMSGLGNEFNQPMYEPMGMNQNPGYQPWMQPRKGWGERLFPLAFILMLVMSFALGSLWTKVEYLKNGPVTAATTTTQQPAAQAPAQVQVSADTIKGLFAKDIIKFGDANRKLLFVEVADPSCPFCHIAGGLNPELNSQSPQFKLVKDGGTYVAPVAEMKKLVDQGKASFAYIYFPGHGAGEMAMKAMYCGYDQGKFWQIHDKLMTSEAYDKINNQFKNDKSQAQALVDYLGNVADKNQLLSCLNSGKYDSRLTQDQQLATSLGVQGTPGFFVNTKNFGGAYSWNDMKADAEAALN